MQMFEVIKILKKINTCGKNLGKHRKNPHNCKKKTIVLTFIAWKEYLLYIDYKFKKHSLKLPTLSIT